MTFLNTHSEALCTNVSDLIVAIDCQNTPIINTREFQRIVLSGIENSNYMVKQHTSVKRPRL